MKKSRLFMVAVLFLTAILVLTATGATDSENSVIQQNEANAVCDALIGAENVGLAMGAYRADTCNTAQLSEAELQAQIDQYNTLVDQYYSTDNPSYELDKTQNEYLLREVFQETTTYLVDGGVTDYEVQTLTFNETNTVAVVSIKMVCYNKWVDAIETGAFEITCCANTVNLTAQMVKVDESWKLQRHIEYTMIDSWVPEDVFTEPQPYSLHQAQEDALQAGELASEEYSNFEDALSAANEIQVEEICPLSVE